MEQNDLKVTLETQIAEEVRLHEARGIAVLKELKEHGFEVVFNYVVEMTRTPIEFTGKVLDIDKVTISGWRVEVNGVETPVRFGALIDAIDFATPQFPTDGLIQVCGKQYTACKPLVKLTQVSCGSLEKKSIQDPERPSLDFDGDDPLPIVKSIIRTNGTGNTIDYGPLLISVLQGNVVLGTFQAMQALKLTPLNSVGPEDEFIQDYRIDVGINGERFQLYVQELEALAPVCEALEVRSLNTATVSVTQLVKDNVIY